jgi:hypothetical protein
MDVVAHCAREEEWLLRHQADLTARRVATDLRQAQSYAQTTSASCKVTFYATTEKYTLNGVASLDGTPGNYQVALTADPYEAKIVSANFGGGGEITFDGWGVPSSGGSVVVSVGSEQRTIAVDSATGQVTIQ